MSTGVYDDDDLVADLLSSMAESLLEDYENTVSKQMMRNQASEHNSATSVHTQPHACRKLYKKPPREIFYRQTITHLTNNNLQIPQKKCSCQFMCQGDNASIKCFSCVIYDKEGIGFYCKPCFSKMHPSYRIDHIYTDIQNDENIPYILSLSQQLADAVRYEKEGEDLAASVRRQEAKLTSIASSSIEEKMRDLGRRTLAVERNIVELRLKNREEPKRVISRRPPTAMSSSQPEIDSKGIRSILRDTAATMIQSMMRAYKCRAVVSEVYLCRVFRVHDSGTKRDYFYDQTTSASSWLPPRFIRRKDYPRISIMKRDSASRRRLWCVKNSCNSNAMSRRRPGKINRSGVAKQIIGGFVRCCLARKVILRLALRKYRRIWDSEYQLYYYLDLHAPREAAEATSWNRPRIFLNEDEPSLLEEIE